MKRGLAGRHTVQNIHEMKAAIRRRYGSIDSIELQDLEKPVPGDKQVLIKIGASTVNRTDCAILTGKPYIMRLFTGILKPKLPITGTDFAGIIIETGKNAKSFKSGDRVFGFNDLGLSSHAEYMVLSEDAPMALMPANFTFEQAAASMEGAHYAVNFLNKVNLKEGSSVLLNGATGAIGSALLQMLKDAHVYVTAVCSTKDMPLIKSLGADKIFDYMREDFTKDGESYDFVFDAVGKSTFAKCRPLLKQGGVYISSEPGPMGQNPLLALITKVSGNKKVIFPVPSDIKSSIRFIKKLLEKDSFRPLIDRQYPLSQIREAYRYAASGEKVGNVVISFD